MGSIEFYVIYNWMRDELNLSGTELDCYAVIYSLSQSDNRYIAGIKRLQELLHKSEPSIIAALKSLTKKELVTKEPMLVNNIKHFYYKAIRPTLKNLSGTPKEILDTPLNNLSSTPLNNLSSINNINNNNININKKSTNVDKKDEDFVIYMKEHYPYLMKMDKPLTRQQAKSLKELYGEDMVLEVFEAMDNCKVLLKKYRDAFRTANNWCKRRSTNDSKQ